MQIAQDHTKAVSNVQSEAQSFGVKDMSLVMEILTKLYSNPIVTLTQEYISNARDANREIRQSRKCEVTAPSRFAPTMIIKDYGPGLSPDRISNVFLFYGASTKRDTDKQTGGFGIGAKSAWAYTDSFTIISNHEGMKRTYIAHRSGGQGNLNLIIESETKEVNGTTIEIAVNPNDVDKFKNAILRSVFFWSEAEKPILKGFTNEELQSQQYQADFTLFKEIKTYDNLPHYVLNGAKHIVVIDGIVYPNRMDVSKLSRLLRQKFVLFINTGAVNMLPSREEFTKDSKSIAVFQALDNDLSTRINKHIDSTVASLPNLKDGLKQFIELRKKFEFTGKYKDYRFDAHNVWLDDPKDPNGWHSRLELGERWEMSRSKFKKGSFNSFSVDMLDRMYYDDMPNEAATKRVWRARKTIENNGGSFNLVKNSLKNIADELGLKTLSSIDASDYKVERATKAAVKKLEICVHFFHGNLDPRQVTIADVNDIIVYASHSGTDGIYNKRSSGDTGKIIRYINSKEDYRFAFIADSYYAKIANNKHFIKYEDFIKTHKPSNEDIRYHLKTKDEPELKISINVYAQLKAIKDSLKDDVLKYFIDLANFNPGNKVSPCLPTTLVDVNNAVVIEHTKMLKAASKMDTKYPLLECVTYDTSKLNNAFFKKDLIAYLNTKHEA